MQPACAVGFGEPVDPFGSGGEQDAVAGLAGADGEAGGEVGLAGAGWSEFRTGEKEFSPTDDGLGLAGFQLTPRDQPRGPGE